LKLLETDQSLNASLPDDGNKNLNSIVGDEIGDSDNDEEHQ